MRNSIKDTMILTKAFFTRAIKIKKSISIKTISLLIILFMLFPIFFSSYYGVAIVIVEIGSKEDLTILLYLAVLIVTSVCFLGCAYKSSSFLFSIKDFELLATLPVKTKSILSAKLITLYLSLLFTSFLFGTPALIVYGMFTEAGFLYYLFAVFIFFMLPIIPMLAGSLLSILLMQFATRFKGKNIIMTLGSFGIIAFSMFISFSMQSTTDHTELLQTFSSFNAIGKNYIVSELFVKALSPNGYLYFFLSLIVNLGLFALFTAFFGKYYNKINSMLTETYSKSNYKMTALKASTALNALYKKELKNYFSSYIYIVNTSIGMIMLIFLAGSTLFYGVEQISAELGFAITSDMVVPAFLAVACLCTGISCTTAPSFSLDAKTLQITKSLPLHFKDIVLSKVLLNMTITIPFIIISAIILFIKFNVSIVLLLIVLLAVLAFSFLAALVGLIANLFLPKMDWKTEVQAIKQSASVLVAILVNMLITVLLGFIYFVFAFLFHADNALCVLLIAIIVAAFAAGAWVFMKSVGNRLYDKL